MVDTLHSRLYKLCSDGKSIQVWEIHRSPDDLSYWTVSGKQGGKMVVSAPMAVAAKVNRTQSEQVTLQMDSKVSVQKRREYVEDINDVGEAADDALPGYSAMLAKKFADEAHKIVYPCAAQPKLDGIRCLTTRDGFFSRGRKPIEACAHIREELRPFFERYPDARLDGELYSHCLKADFEKIIMAVRKSAKKATAEDLEFQRQIQYHIYDAPRIDDLDEDYEFVDRFATLCDRFDFLGASSIVLVETKFHIASEDDLMDVHLEFTKQGYEGTMVRNMAMPYEGKRSHNLLKLKEFDEAEFKVIDVKEGKGKLVGHAGAFIMVTDGGATFRGKLEGALDRLKGIWDDPSSVVGKVATVRYQGITNREKVPRFPVVKCVRGLDDGSDWL